MKLDPTFGIDEVSFLSRASKGLCSLGHETSASSLCLILFSCRSTIKYRWTVEFTSHGHSNFSTEKARCNTRISQAKIMARQGLHHLGMEEVDIKDPVTMKSVPPDAKTMGEVMFRGNTVMNGYLKNSEAIKDAFKGGWYRSGDLGVKHLDGIISRGENISTIEVESVLFSHPSMLEVAVVGRQDDHCGETPCAFVKLMDGCDTSSDELIKYCRNRSPHFMAPCSVVFQDLPKTSAVKTQKFVLREKAKAMGSISEQRTSKL